MKFLITGGLGFIGSNFILHLIKNYPEFKIINVDAEFDGSNRLNLESIKNYKKYGFVKGNITDKKIVDKVVSKADIVFNFAAESHVDRSITNPRPFMDSNILGMYTLLESVRKYKKKIIQISTDEVFGSLRTGSADEKYPFNPSSPYAASKASAELLVQSYVKTYNCDAIITRCTNNYGPMQSPEKLIPKAIILAEKESQIPIYGTGKNVRDWIFVLDHCEAIMQVYFKGKIGESYNISADNEVDNLAIVRKILDIMKKSKDLIQLTEDRPGHDFRYSLVSKKIRRKMNWKPRHNLKEGLEYTVKWYLANKRWWKHASNEISSPYRWKTR